METSTPPNGPITVTLQVDALRAGARLDVAIAALRPVITRSSAQRLIETDAVRVDGRKRPQGFRVPEGSIITITMPDAPPQVHRAQTGDLAILAEDDDFLAVNKRPGLVVHPGAGNQSGTLLNILLASGRPLSGLGGPDRAGLVHRLDRETSGVMLVAKTDAAHVALSAQFANRVVQKTYLALVLGTRLPDRGCIRSSFGRRPGDRKQFTGRPGAGTREAITEFEVLGRASLCSLVAVHPRTGRTHQIRVHLSENGYPILGDRVYGRAYPRPGSRPEQEAAILREMKRQALHAWSIRFLHPTTNEPRIVVAPLPADFIRVLVGVFGDGWESLLPR